MQFFLRRSSHTLRPRQTFCVPFYQLVINKKLNKSTFKEEQPYTHQLDFGLIPSIVKLSNKSSLIQLRMIFFKIKFRFRTYHFNLLNRL